VRRVAAFLLQDDGYPSFIAPRAGVGQGVRVVGTWADRSPWRSRRACSWGAGRGRRSGGVL